MTLRLSKIICIMCNFFLGRGFITYIRFSKVICDPPPKALQGLKRDTRNSL
ncbi:hypothetical protein I79_024219 [Cricetulus griseus]|uniref:Uncharacterized protein n=1 Tax=Cricetulus griseus TaxID=10029 RepID=G3IK25_CRIGR|nr:hypothetical protein I79_024219 [Cricetulus griseus]